MLQTDAKGIDKKMEDINHLNSLEKVSQISLNFLVKLRLFLNFYINQSLEWFWKILICSIIILFNLVISAIYQFQTSPVFQHVPKGSPLNLIMGSLLMSFIYIIYDRKMHNSLDQKFEKHYLSLKYQGKQVRMKRSVSMVKYGIGITYYIITSTLGIKILLQSNVIPSWLGGSGQCKNLYIFAPYEPNANISISILYAISLGKHFARLILHCFVTSQGNFYSYLLHHLLSVFLIMYSYSMNLWIIGVFILVVHDSSDLVNSIVRFYMEYRYPSKWIMGLFYVVFPVVWIGSRNIIFPLCCIYPSLQVAKIKKYSLTDGQLEILQFSFLFGIGMLICLEILHIVWTVGLISYIRTKLKSSKTIKKI